MDQVAKRRSWYRRHVAAFICAFLFGVFGGCVCAGAGDSGQIQPIRTYLHDYMSLTAQNGVVLSAWSIVRNHLVWAIACFILGANVLSVIFVPVMIGTRAFLFAFGIGCFVRSFGISGIVPAGVLFGLSAALWLPAMMLCALCAMRFTVNFPRRKVTCDQQPFLSGRERGRMLLLSGIMIFMCVCMECWLFPALLPVVARMIIG